MGKWAIDSRKYVHIAYMHDICDENGPVKWNEFSAWKYNQIKAEGIYSKALWRQEVKLEEVTPKCEGQLLA